jgi:hypothetical protein
VTSIKGNLLTIEIVEHKQKDFSIQNAKNIKVKKQHIKIKFAMHRETLSLFGEHCINNVSDEKTIANIPIKSH